MILGRRRIVVGISGASGSVYGISILRALQTCKIEVHLVLSRAAKVTLQHEMGMGVQDLADLADFHYASSEIGAAIASGSFSCDGMIIAPCSVNTMSEIAHGICSNLLTRAAGVTIKETRKLVLLIRESPLHLVHLRNLVTLAEMGVVIFPPIPSFYDHPQSIEDITNNIVGRALNFFQIDLKLFSEWKGLSAKKR